MLVQIVSSAYAVIQGVSVNVSRTVLKDAFKKNATAGRSRSLTLGSGAGPHVALTTRTRTVVGSAAPPAAANQSDAKRTTMANAGLSARTAERYLYLQ